jgi:hypothetical protein
MSLLMILGIWIAVSVVLTPLVGFFLSGAWHRAAERRARRAHKEIDSSLPTRTTPPA